MALLHPGDKSPALAVALPGGGSLQLPDALSRSLRRRPVLPRFVVPVLQCTAPGLPAGQGRAGRVGAEVVALSVDDETTTADLIARLGLEFPVGHSADARALAEATGAFVSDDPLFVQSTGFVLNPRGEVVVSVYSSGAIGRLVPEDVIGLIRYLREHAA